MTPVRRGGVLSGASMAKPYWKTCKNGKLLRRVMAEVMPPNVHVLWGANRDRDDARLRFIEEGKRYCHNVCGGCPLTEGYVPPE